MGAEIGEEEKNAKCSREEGTTQTKAEAVGEDVSSGAEKTIARGSWFVKRFSVQTHLEP